MYRDSPLYGRLGGQRVEPRHPWLGETRLLRQSLYGNARTSASVMVPHLGPPTSKIGIRSNPTGPVASWGTPEGNHDLRTRHCLIIICSGIPRRTPRGSWPCNGWLSSRTGLPGAAAPSGGRHSARPYFGRGTSGHRRSADAPDRLGCFHVPGSLTRCLCPRTTAGSNRHRRPGRQRLPRGVSEAVLEVEGPTPRPSDW
ncbi:hypothetical protein GGP65_000893 [Salinibacter ruber]|uniref:Uncharacterized protein n=1 Tax=Salinibacter ruber TaxID=146919 RepID=A0AAW5P5D4_9BACT|nr:hypothetical protein [Salinibacter ruber]MCS4157187.1 hypothetical protein [Salinibacter ruber]MCS4223102.1 hypothetical protein [Salinibacter ruber]